MNLWESLNALCLICVALACRISSIYVLSVVAADTFFGLDWPMWTDDHRLLYAAVLYLLGYRVVRGFHDRG